jgi:ABC-type sugar transport system permease subunit
MRRTPREILSGYLFILPAVLLIGWFVLWPTLDMLRISLFQPSWFGRDSGEFVGLKNYADLLADPRFRQSLWNTALFTLLTVPLQAGLALALAVWANAPHWRSKWLRAAIFIPTTFSLAVLSVVWELMYRPATATGAGLLNGLLSSAGLTPQPFLESPAQALPALVVMSVWQGVGLQMLVFLSGLQAIPDQLYEAARLDGAGRWRCFQHVTLPGVAPTAAFVILITTIFSLRLFVQPHLMTGGGPDGATRSVVQYVYEAAFANRDLGLACAAGGLFFLIVLVLTVVLRRLLRRMEALA